MRSQLGSVSQIYSFETDLDNQTATIVYDPALDIEQTLDALSVNSDKLSEWSIGKQKSYP